MKKGYWVVAYKSISDDSAVKAYGGISSAGGAVIRRALFDQVYEPGSGPRSRTA